MKTFSTFTTSSYYTLCKNFLHVLDRLKLCALTTINFIAVNSLRDTKYKNSNLKGISKEIRIITCLRGIVRKINHYALITTIIAYTNVKI